MLLTPQETQPGQLAVMNHDAGLSLEAWKFFLVEKSIVVGSGWLPVLGWGHRGAGCGAAAPPPQEDAHPDSLSLLPERHHAIAHRVPQGERDHGAAPAGPWGPDRNKDQGGCQQAAW